MKIITAKAAAIALSLAASATMAQENSLSYSIQKSMDPQVMTNLMNGMMSNPAGTLYDPITTCAQCHDGSDMARYQQALGPMMAMLNPANWFSPQAYMSMMTGMMDPKTYELWYNGIMTKYAGTYGSAASAGAGESPTAEAPVTGGEGESGQTGESQEQQ